MNCLKKNHLFDSYSKPYSDILVLTVLKDLLNVRR